MGNLKQSNLPFVACFIDSVSFLTQSPLIFQYFKLPRMPIRVGRVKYVNPGRKVNPSDSSDPSANSNLTFDFANLSMSQWLVTERVCFFYFAHFSVAQWAETARVRSLIFEFLHVPMGGYCESFCFDFANLSVSQVEETAEFAIWLCQFLRVSMGWDCESLPCDS